MADMITDPNAPAQPKAGPELYVGLEGVHVEFPAGYWDHPSHDLVARDGRPMRDHAVRNLALAIADGLQKALASRRRPTGLVGPDGRPL